MCYHVLSSYHPYLVGICWFISLHHLILISCWLMLVVPPPKSLVIPLQSLHPRPQATARVRNSRPSQGTARRSSGLAKLFREISMKYLCPWCKPFVAEIECSVKKHLPFPVMPPRAINATLLHLLCETIHPVETRQSVKAAKGQWAVAGGDLPIGPAAGHQSSCTNKNSQNLSFHCLPTLCSG